MTIWLDFAELRRRVSLEDVLVRMYRLEDRLKRQGDKLIGPCPIHDGDSPRAFHADLVKQAWFCFSRCRKGGNQIDFVAAKENVPVREAALRLHAFFLGGDAPTASAPSSPPVRTPAHVAGSLPPLVPTGVEATGPPAIDAASGPINPPLALRLTLQHDHPHLLVERGLSAATIQHFGAGYCARGTLRGMVAIPIRDEDGDLVAYAGRRLKWADVRENGKYKFARGFRKELVLYNLDQAKAHAERDGLVIAEGFFAVMKLFELGVPNAVAVMGCALSEAQADLVAEHCSDVTILFDGNEAGRGGAEEARKLLADRVRTHVVHVPHDVQADAVPARTLRWALRGAKELDLSDVTFLSRRNKTE